MPIVNKVPQEIKQAIREKYAWPGVYPLYLITGDCQALCVTCAKKEYKQVAWAIRHRMKRDCWYIEAADINWEDPSLYCDHCSQRIESASAEDEAQSCKETE